MIARHAMAFAGGGATVAMLIAAAVAARIEAAPLYEIGIILAALAGALAIPPASYALGLGFQRRYMGMPRHDRTVGSFALGLAHAVFWTTAWSLADGRGEGILAFAILAPASYSFLAMWLGSPLARSQRDAQPR